MGEQAAGILSPQPATAGCSWRLPRCLIRPFGCHYARRNGANLHSRPSQPELSIQRPAPGQTVRKIFDFAASTRQPTATATVEFRIGSRRLGIANSKLARVIWNTGYASDGVYQLQVIGRNAGGQVLSTADRLFTINNHGNSLNVVSPDLDRPLSGVANLFNSWYRQAVLYRDLDCEY